MSIGSSTDEREPPRRRFVEAMTAHGVPREAAREAVATFQLELDNSFRATVLQVGTVVAKSLSADQRDAITQDLRFEAGRVADPTIRMFIGDMLVALRPPRADDE